MMLARSSLTDCILWACQTEVNAPKPGNVNQYSGANNMQLVDFIASAQAISPVLSRTDLSVGDMILSAVIATRRVVNCNTNLGIILLFAPLCKAVQLSNDINQIQDSLSLIVDNLTVDDAKKCYQAIRLAKAGGLGKSEQHDIHDEPLVTLKQAMSYAQHHDSIAAQYINNFHHVFHIGLLSLTKAINYGETVEWACAFAYLNLLVALPDSLVSRKYGFECARSIQQDSIIFLKKLSNDKRLSDFETDITKWDNELKQKAINPGTTADMTAAALLLYAFKQTLS